MTSLKIKTPFLDMEWKPQDEDKNAAWDLYIELLTRITTQALDDSHGNEEAVLKSIHAIFPLTREVIKTNGRHCVEFTKKIAVIVLNQVIRPFTAKCHRLSEQGAFSDENKCSEFHVELLELQATIVIYTKMLGDMAGMEDDLTELEYD
jgi:hypothetical protein